MKDASYLITMAIAGIIFTATMVYIAATTNAFTPQNVTAPSITIPRFEEIPEQTIDCKICHEKPEDIIKHRNGGRYCTKCHGDDLHRLHTQEETVNLTCQYCHTEQGRIPRRLPGHESICDSCHGYPDPLQPSFGNLIDIHIKKGHTCDLCHVQDIQSLHEKNILSSKLAGSG